MGGLVVTPVAVRSTNDVCGDGPCWSKAGFDSGGRLMPLNRLVDSGVPFQPDVQSTTLGLDVLSRYVTNTYDEAVNNGGAPFHAIVIGGGMFGAYCATQILRLPGCSASTRSAV